MFLLCLCTEEFKRDKQRWISLGVSFVTSNLKLNKKHEEMFFLCQIFEMLFELKNS